VIRKSPVQFIQRIFVKKNVSKELKMCEGLKSPYSRQKVPAGWQNIIGHLISLIILVDNCRCDSLFRV